MMKYIRPRGNEALCMKLVEARYEAGFLKPKEPLSLRQGERVLLILVRHPDSKRWNLDRLKKCGSEKDLELTKLGLAE